MRTLLLGLDGATFTVLDHLVAEGEMPNLENFYRHGTRSRLRSTPVPITPQAGTSLATGRSMGNHGLNDFVRIDLADGRAYAHFNTSKDNHCETLWKYASRQGKRVTILNYFGTAPPQELNGQSIPGFVPSRYLRRSSWPPELIPALKDLGTIDVSCLGLELDVEKQALSRMPEERWIPWIDQHIAREEAWFKTLEHLMIEDPSDLTIVVFDGVDKVQHLAYRFLDPSTAPRDPSPWEAEVIERCRVYFRKVDEYLGRMIELLGDDARVFIASDHGFTDSTEIVYVNKWLHEQGLLFWKEEQEVDTKEAIYVDHLKDYLGQLDLERTKAFALTPSSNGIFINVPDDEYAAFQEDLVRRLETFQGPDGGQVVIEVKKREEWFAGPYMHHAADLTLTLRDYGHISVLNGRETVVPRSESWGTHHPDGVLLAAGEGIRQGHEEERQDILDVAPLLLHSVGLPIPVEYEGAFPAGFFEEAHLASDPPLIGGATQAPDSGASGEVQGDLDEEDQAILLQRLRSLGYIE
ncbi:MAG: alkaline phosphatase family protein [Planctomycetota bacterium]|nr:alkaline phosphatase family protein [Planctomycetota bacterium]